MPIPPVAPEISVVLPVYRTRAALPELYRRLCAALDAGGRAYELIFVDDACPQGSLADLRELERRDARVRVIAHPANRGQHRAVLSGLEAACGDRMVVMDADLQDPPEAVPALVERLGAGYGAVYAARRGRYQSGGRLLTSRLFKTLVARLSGMPADAGLFLAMSRGTVRRLLAFQRHEPRPYLTAMIAMVGRPVDAVPVERDVREIGASAYSGWARLRLGVRGVYQTLRLRRRAASFCGWGEESHAND